MNGHPNIAFLGGTVIIAIMVMAAFANVANTGGYSYSKSKSVIPCRKLGVVSSGLRLLSLMLS